MQIDVAPKLLFLFIRKAKERGIKKKFASVASIEVTDIVKNGGKSDKKACIKYGSLTREYSQLSDVVWLHILSMNRTQWDQENPKMIHTNDLLDNSYGYFTEFLLKNGNNGAWGTLKISARMDVSFRNSWTVKNDSSFTHLPKNRLHVKI